MEGQLRGTLEETWSVAFGEVRFPAFIVDAKGKPIEANWEGQAWLSRNDLGRELEREGAPSLPLDADALVEMPPKDGSVGMALLGLRGGRALIGLSIDSFDQVADYVRLYRSFLRTSETLRMRNDRLEVYHELLTHDAPNYITAVYGYLQMIQAQELPREKLQKYIDTSIKQTEALNHLIDTARSLRQLETSPLGPVQTMDLREAVEESVTSVRAAGQDKTVNIRDNIPPGHYLVQAEEGLKEVFNIILTNAVRYSDSPQVMVDLIDEGGSWHLMFEDNGRGIPDDKKEFLFLRFDRLDKQKKIRGSGLSLALARALVERHGGKIWVENRVENDYTKGSVFHVRLPKA